MAEPTKHPTKAERRASTRERIEEMRREEERKRKITKTIVATLITLAIIAAIVGIAWVVSNRETTKNEAGASPTNVSEIGGVMLAAQNPPASPSTPATPTSSSPSPSAPTSTTGTTTSPASSTPPATTKVVTVTEYFDFICPACKQFLTTVGPTLNTLREQGKISIESVPLGFLDKYSKDSYYSTRSATAAYCVAEYDRPLYKPFVDVMFANQPAENTAGLTNEQIRDYAKQVGAGEKTQQCIMDQTFSGYVTRMATKAQQAGVTGTPTILVNGKKFSGQTWDELNTMIEEAGK